MTKTRFEKLQELIGNLQEGIDQINLDEKEELDQMIPSDIKAAMDLVASRYRAKRESLQIDIDKAQHEIDLISSNEQ